MGKEIEQLKAGRELVARDNANVSELTRGVARLSEQLKASQEQVARDNANVAEQIKAIQDQLGRIISQAAQPNAPPRVAAAPRRSVSFPSIGPFGRKTTKCDMEKFAAKPTRMETSFATKTSTKYERATSVVVAANTPRIPEATNFR